MGVLGIVLAAVPLQECPHQGRPVPHAVDFILVRIRRHQGKRVQIVDPALRHPDALPMLVEIALGLEAVQPAEHGAVVHVVAVDQVITVRAVPRVSRCQVDGPGQRHIAIDVMGGVIQIVLPLHDGIVDARIVDRQPAPVILVDRRQGVPTIRRRRAVVHDLRLVLQQIPGGFVGAVGGGEGVIQHVAGVKDQDGSQQPGHQRNHAATQLDGAQRQIDLPLRGALHGRGLVFQRILCPPQLPGHHVPLLSGLVFYIFSRLRAGVPLGVVSNARKTVQWTVFSEKRAEALGQLAPPSHPTGNIPPDD